MVAEETVVEDDLLSSCSVADEEIVVAVVDELLLGGPGVLRVDVVLVVFVVVVLDLVVEENGQGKPGVVDLLEEDVTFATVVTLADSIRNTDVVDRDAELVEEDCVELVDLWRIILSVERVVTRHRESFAGRVSELSNWQPIGT